jgi:uncharacterized membrane protein YoaK (UPF0700 family)
MTGSVRASQGLLLTGVAGWVDAVGFIRLGGFYPSFMSGNTTRLGVALSRDEWALVALAAAIIALFFLGSFASGLAAALAPRWRLAAVLGLDAAILLAAVVIVFTSGGEKKALLLLPIAMGVQNGAMQELRHQPGGTTFVTGALFRAGHDLAQALVGRGPTGWFGSLITWASFALGATAGAVADLRWEMAALSVPLVIVVMLAALAIAAPLSVEEVRS